MTPVAPEPSRRQFPAEGTPPFQEPQAPRPNRYITQPRRGSPAPSAGSRAAGASPRVGPPRPPAPGRAAGRIPAATGPAGAGAPAGPQKGCGSDAPVRDRGGRLTERSPRNSFGTWAAPNRKRTISGRTSHSWCCWWPGLWCGACDEDRYRPNSVVQPAQRVVRVTG